MYNTLLILRVSFLCMDQSRVDNDALVFCFSFQSLLFESFKTMMSIELLKGVKM